MGVRPGPARMAPMTRLRPGGSWKVDPLVPLVARTDQFATYLERERENKGGWGWGWGSGRKRQDRIG